MFTASIIIPLYNGLKYTAELWDSIRCIAEENKHQYIFIDNCSSDGSREWLSVFQNHHNVKVILNSENRNFAGACNQGATSADSDCIIFLNNDTQVTPGWSDSLIEILKSEPAVAAVGNKQIFPGTNLIHHAGIYFDLTGHPKHYLEGAFEDDPRVNFRRDCKAVTAACLAMRKNEFLAVGGFFEGFKNGYEDVDLCLNLYSSGRKITYSEKSKIFHHVSKSPGRGVNNQHNYELFISRCKNCLIPDIDLFLRENQNHYC